MSDFPLFSVMGIEIEYMLVDDKTLEVRPLSDVILNTLGGLQTNEVELGEIAISNELVMHVLELKNNGPKPPSAPINAHFQDTILSLQPLLKEHGLCLLPTGAHPWMNPMLETRRWPHGNQDIYRQYDKVFNCKGHGFANLQSMHINLPFANDEEFCRLHNATRLLLPLLPALAASTPFLDGKLTGIKDSRLFYYGTNQKRIPSISGDIIPEFIRSQDEYENLILKPMYEDIKPHDPTGILQYEWLNSRGAIAKFAYKAIEIRVLDTQECVEADIAIAQLVFALLRQWCLQSDLFLTKPYETKGLKYIYAQCIQKGLSTIIEDYALLEQWQVPKKTMPVRDVWSLLIEHNSTYLDQKSQRALEHILSAGNLSERLVKACHSEYTQEKLRQLYRQLKNCLINNQLFYPS